MEIWVGAGPDVGCRSKTQCRGMFVGRRDKKMVGASQAGVLVMSSCPDLPLSFF